VQQPGFEAATPLEAFTGLLAALRVDYAPVAGQFIAAQLPEPDSEDAARVLHDAAMRINGPVAAAVADAAGHQDLREIVRRVEVPALVLHGALDAVVPAQAGWWLAQNLPKVERHVELPDLGHCPLLTAPSVVAGELSAFV
jgi:pimeloyl-ACP methyl ester carboxylesterase